MKIQLQKMNVKQFLNSFYCIFHSALPLIWEKLKGNGL